MVGFEQWRVIADDWTNLQLFNLVFGSPVQSGFLPQKRGNHGPKPVQTVAKIRWTTTEPIRTETHGLGRSSCPWKTGCDWFFAIVI